MNIHFTVSVLGVAIVLAILVFLTVFIGGIYTVVGLAGWRCLEPLDVLALFVLGICWSGAVFVLSYLILAGLSTL